MKKKVKTVKKVILLLIVIIILVIVKIGKYALFRCLLIRLFTLLCHKGKMPWERSLLKSFLWKYLKIVSLFFHFCFFSCLWLFQQFYQRVTPWHGPTGVMTLPVMLDFHDDSWLYTFTIYQQLEIARSSQLRAPAKAFSVACLGRWYHHTCGETLLQLS